MINDIGGAGSQPTPRTLNFEAGLEGLIRSGVKTRTWRLDNSQQIREGDDVLLTSGGRAVALVRVVAMLWTTVGWAFEHKLAGHEGVAPDVRVHRPPDALPSGDGPGHGPSPPNLTNTGFEECVECQGSSRLLASSIPPSLAIVTFRKFRGSPRPSELNLRTLSE